MDPMKHLSAFLYGLAPTSTLLCSAEGDPPGEGGGQAPQQPPPAPAQPASPPQFTPDQMAWIEAEKTRASNAAAAAARRAEQGRQGRGGEPQQPQHSNPPQQPQANGADPAQVYMRLRTFDRAVDRYGLTDSARSILEGDFNTANPQDPVAWVTQRAEAFGWKAAGSSNPATPAPETPAPKITPPGAPVTAGGAPANPTHVVTDDTPILRMSESDRVALMNRIGRDKYVDRMRQEFRTGNVRVRFNK